MSPAGERWGSRRSTNLPRTWDASPYPMRPPSRAARHDRACLGGLARAASLWERGVGRAVDRDLPADVREAVRRFLAREYRRTIALARLDREMPAVCGARTRSGKPCAAHPVVGRRRCRMHGGCSTGPKTAEGRARSLAAIGRA